MVNSTEYELIMLKNVKRIFSIYLHDKSLSGIDGKLLEWLNSYLSQRKQEVSFKSCYSGLKSIFAGVPQGSVLGPLLILVYINDIAKNLLV